MEYPGFDFDFVFSGGESDGGILVVLGEIEVGVLLGQSDLGDDEEVGFLVGGVGAEDDLVERVVLRVDRVGQPLHRQRGPLELVADHQVVQERRVLLPDLVLLVDDLVLVLVVEV